MKHSPADDAGPWCDLPDVAALRLALPGPFRRAARLHPRRGQPTGWGVLELVPWNAAGRFHAAEIDPGTRLDYHTGCMYPQDAASQVPVFLLNPRPGDVVIDCCAAPGSKSTQIGLALGDNGLLVCCDANPPRRAVLAETLARQGVACAVVTPMPVARLAERSPGCADAVLVDAPCSGHGERSLKQTTAMGRRQLELLRTAARLVRPGGRLVYSTCTPYRQENEAVVRGLLAADSRFTVEAVAANGCDDDLDGLGALRLWPHRQGTEPFFACLLRADDSGPHSRLMGRVPQHLHDLAAILPRASWHVWRHGDLLFAGSPQAASCALPSDARGIIVGRGTTLKLEAWGAQAVIERGASAQSIRHSDACRLWAGETCDIADGLVRTEAGAPLGEMSSGRLRLPSRMCRAGLV